MSNKKVLVEVRSISSDGSYDLTFLGSGKPKGNGAVMTLEELDERLAKCRSQNNPFPKGHPGPAGYSGLRGCPGPKGPVIGNVKEYIEEDRKRMEGTNIRPRLGYLLAAIALFLVVLFALSSLPIFLGWLLGQTVG